MKALFSGEKGFPGTGVNKVGPPGQIGYIGYPGEVN